MQMLYCFVNNIHVDYVELMWEGFYYPEISRRARDKYHNLSDDDLMKNIFNLGRYRDKVRMKILDWMITEEMQLTKYYRMTLSTPRSPNLEVEAGESSALRRSTVIRLRIPQRRSPRLTPPALMPTVDEADDMILQDTIQVSLAEQSGEEQEAKENVELVKEHLAAEVIEKIVKEPENVVDDSSNPRNDEHDIPNIRIDPKSDKKSLEVEITDSEKMNNRETEITNVVIPVNVNEDKEEIIDEVYELKRKEKGKIVEESKSTPSPTPIRSIRIHDTLVSSDTKKPQ
ncbi:hypothetical protein Tco_0076897, partial [Tanacetum coccineum]